MRPLPSRRALGLLLIAVFALPARGDESEASGRLESMPREQRQILAANLERFDSLPDSEKRAIRELDRTIESLDPADRSRYHGVLRRYHTWFSNLPKADQEKIRAAASDSDRIRIVNQLHERDRQRWRPVGAKTKGIGGLSLSDIATYPPYELGVILRVWFALTPEERTEFNGPPNLNAKLMRLRNRGLAKGISMERFPENLEREYAARIDADASSREVTNLVERANKAREAAKKKAGLPARVRPHQGLIEALYYAEHPPQRVEPARLARFDAALPDWLREPILDPLLPEDAQRVLTILYRQVYPAGTEIADAKAEPSKAADPAKKVAPAAKPGPTSNPAHF